MKTPLKWNFKSIAGKLMLGFVLITMIGSINIEPALGKDNHNSGGKHDKGRYEKQYRGQKRGHYVPPRPVYRPYGYYGHREPVYYPPPPVVYAPPPPPGIHIFFPPIVIHP